MDAFPPGFFDDKVTVGVNQVWMKFPCTYVVQHHKEGCQEIIDKGLKLVTSEYDCGQYDWGLNDFEGRYFFYCHSDSPQCAGIDLAALDTEDSLAISAATSAEAIHFAAYLGATTIYLCGLDGGRIDGKMNFEGYNGGGAEFTTRPQHLPMTEPLIIRLVTELRNRGIAVLSLNPYINFGLEGHKYSRPPVGLVYMPNPDVQAEQKVIGLKPAKAVV